jgi:hypothetical protein
MKTYNRIFLLAALFLTFMQCSVYAQWVEQNSGVTRKLNSIDGYTDGNAWVCGDSGAVLRTTNYGINWINVSGNGIPLNVNLVGIFDAFHDLNAYTCGNSPTSSYIFTTSNGGSHWTQVYSEAGGQALAIGCETYIGNPIGGRWSIWKSDFLGTTWDSVGLYLPQSNSEHGWKNAVRTTGNCSWQFAFGSNAGKIYERYNGSAWQVFSNLPELNVSALDWVGGVKGYFGGSNLYVTTNFGVSWQIMSAPGTGNFISIEGTYNNLWCLRPDNKIYNLDSLNNWNISYTPPNGNITMMKNIFTYMFSLRDNGGISRRVITGGPLGITQLSNIIPKSFSLSQNYPNPFNPSTKIKFQITKLGNAKLVIYDALGREVSTLVNEQLQPGIYESELDGSNFPSGVYFYQLTVNSEQLTKFTETKKLVLIK